MQIQIDWHQEERLAAIDINGRDHVEWLQGPYTGKRAGRAYVFQNRIFKEVLEHVPLVLDAKQQAFVCDASVSEQMLFDCASFLGYQQKKVPAKKQHAWKKSLAQTIFVLDHPGANGRMQWRKRKELVLFAGARLQNPLPVNQDGTPGFDTTLAEKLRQDRVQDIQDGCTTRDLVFQSVNELGLFLYGGRCNGWLQWKDDQGQVLDALAG